MLHAVTGKGVVYAIFSLLRPTVSRTGRSYRQTYVDRYGTEFLRIKLLTSAALAIILTVQSNTSVVILSMYE